MQSDASRLGEASGGARAAGEVATWRKLLREIFSDAAQAINVTGSSASVSALTSPMMAACS